MSARISSIEEIKDHWQAFKSIETHAPADIDRQLLLLTQDVVMENPMMRVEGRDSVREFLLQQRQVHPLLRHLLSSGGVSSHARCGNAGPAGEHSGARVRFCQRRRMTSANRVVH